MGGTRILLGGNVTCGTLTPIQAQLKAQQYGGLVKKAKLKGRLR